MYYLRVSHEGEKRAFRLHSALNIELSHQGLGFRTVSLIFFAGAGRDSPCIWVYVYFKGIYAL